MAAIDVAGYVADLKDHSVDHGFHVHDERHFVETYSLRQVWEVDLHPEEGCGGPLDLHLALDVDPRVLLSFEDAVVLLSEDEEPPDEFHFPLTFTWALPPLPSGPDLLRLAIDLAGVGGIELPLEVSAIDSFANATDGSERRLSIVARHPVSLARVLSGEELLCDVFDRALAVSRFLLESAEALAAPDVRRARRRGGRRVLARWRPSSPARSRLSACGGQSGQALAQQACVHVHRSVHDYVRSTVAGTPPATRRPSCRSRPISELRAALPLAAAGQLGRRLVELAHDHDLGERHRRRGPSASPRSRRSASSPTPTRTSTRRSPGLGTHPAEREPEPGVTRRLRSRRPPLGRLRPARRPRSAA